MARIALSLLALFLSATYVAGHVAPSPAPTDAGIHLEAICKQTHDVNYCLQLLQPTVTADTQFDSLEWYRKVLSKALSKTIIAKSFMTRHVRGLDAREHIALTSCADKLSVSVELLQQVSREYVELYKAKVAQGFLYGLHKKNVQALMDTARADQEACRATLENHKGQTMQQVRDISSKAFAATKIVSDIILNR